MLKRFLIVLLALCIAQAAFALTGPRRVLLGSGHGSGPTPPSSCSNRLDFSHACNSQYLF